MRGENCKSITEDVRSNEKFLISGISLTLEKVTVTPFKNNKK